MGDDNILLYRNLHLTMVRDNWEKKILMMSSLAGRGIKRKVRKRRKRKRFCCTQN